jgi:eukaryotic-like serine/threonine-protein kinase
MDPTKLSVDQILLAAFEKPTSQERSAYLDQVCAGDDELRHRVERLLRAQPNLGNFLESPAPEFAATVFDSLSERPGTVIGPYKLLEQIGEGGFGIVYMADQEAPIHRRVALKIIKPGMDTRMVLARFKAELEALSLMDHPNIARVLDDGATDSGRPYFVMELVRGIPITDYSDQNNLPVHERLGLFAQVCRAVPCSTRTRRESFTGTSSPLTCWSHCMTDGRCPR